MEDTQPAVTQSQFYTPVFNTAVFDGPFRIYFAQKDEPEALKIYYKMKKNLEFQFSEDIFEKVRENILLMIYPDQKSFENAFPNSDNPMLGTGDLGLQKVIGVFFSVTEFNISPLIKAVESLFKDSRLDFSEKQVSMEL